MDNQLAKMNIHDMSKVWRCTSPTTHEHTMIDFLADLNYIIKGIIISDFNKNPDAAKILIDTIELYKKLQLDTSGLETYYSEKMLFQVEDILDTIDNLLAAKMGNTVNAKLAKHFFNSGDPIIPLTVEP
jgi:hypothetical protein